MTINITNNLTGLIGSFDFIIPINKSLKDKDLENNSYDCKLQCGCDEYDSSCRDELYDSCRCHNDCNCYENCWCDYECDCQSED